MADDDRIKVQLDTLEKYLLVRVEKVEAIADERHKATDRAIRINNIEIQRRLKGLNGEAARLRLMQATYLPRELYDSRHRELEERIVALREFRAAEKGRQAVLAFIVAAGVSILVALMAHFLPSGIVR